MARWESGQLLAEVLAPTGLFPLRIPLKHPLTCELGSQFTQVQQWIQELRSKSGLKGINLEWREINHRQLGRNQLPVALRIESASDAIDWLGKTSKLRAFLPLASQLLTIFPKLQSWVLKKPHQLLIDGENLSRLMAVLHWLSEHPKPNIYLRQLSLPGIDTKFIEQHKKLLAEWFDLQLPAEAIANQYSSANRFALRYGFQDKADLIRFRILDKSLYLHDLSDITIPTQEFSRLSLPVDVVFVTENDINALTFPDFSRAMVLFGRGYGFDFLTEAAWLKDKQIRYWGDIDTHGFAILNQFRQHLPQTESLLMDEGTFLSHKTHWTTEPKPNQGKLKNLSPEETALYTALQKNHYGQNIRLEQEYISYNVFSEQLCAKKCIE